MPKALVLCAAVIALAAIFSTRAEAVDPFVDRGKAISASYRAPADRHYASCGYYLYVCRAWWTGCRLEGPFAFPLNRYWGYRYLCW
jgi:hypothetical protein